MVICTASEFGTTMEAVRSARKYAVAFLCGLVVCISWAQKTAWADGDARIVRKDESVAQRSSPRRTIPVDDGLQIIAAALDNRAQARSEKDCSHLTHAIYQDAGFPYPYASSSDLYAGVEGFQRVSRVQPGDLIAWRGHVGIVVSPARYLFFSVLRSGPGIDDWQTPYWKSRGRARFYRYVKNAANRDLKISYGARTGVSR